MAKRITWVGIDDDKMNLTVAVLRGSRQKEAEVRRIPNDDRALRRWVRRLVRDADGGEIRMCYEAGPNGFALMRRLESMGPVVVEVVAPSLTPRRSGQRVKTDPIDARKLAHLYRADELRAIAIPGEDSESSRDLVRTYHRVGEEATRKRHHILKFLIRRGRIYRDGSHWIGKHRVWLRAQRFASWKDTVIFEEYLAGLAELEDRRRRLMESMEKLAQEDVHAVEVGALRCFRGIDTAMALTLVTEIFNAERFPHPREMMSYFGLTPSVHQSADRESRGSITKAGNRYARWALGQVAKYYRGRPRVGESLKRRRRGQPVWAIGIADRALHRLHKRSWALQLRGMMPMKVTTAVARELVAFVWEVLVECRRRARQQAA
jgi:transposase